MNDSSISIAVITTVWYPLSHADVIVTRWLNPYPGDEKRGWNGSRCKISAVYIEQLPSNDIGQRFCQEHQIPICGSVQDTITDEAGRLNVDGIMIIAEHGDYPINELGQKLYPRKRLFDEIVEVFQSSGRSVPVFNDKHFSWSFQDSCKMLEMATTLGFPLYGGSSIPHCPLIPSPSLSEGDEVTDIVSLFYGDLDSYGFHAMEFAQSLIEKRLGGETGVAAVRVFSGAEAVEQMRSVDFPSDLVHSAFVQHGYPDSEEIVAFLWSRSQEIELVQIAHCDGLIVNHILVPKFVNKWIVAVKLSNDEIKSCEAVAGTAPDFYNNFACLNGAIDKFLTKGYPPSPVLRTHLVTGMLEAAQQASRRMGQWLNTPQLAIRYCNRNQQQESRPDSL